MTDNKANLPSDFVKQSQDAMRTAFDSWSKTIKDVTGHLPTVQPTTDPKDVIDQVFDFAVKLLDVQREFAKNVVATSASVGEHLGDVTEKATAATRSAASKVTGN